MKHHRPIILTVGAFMAVSALTFSSPARSDVTTAPAAPTVPGCPDAANPSGPTSGALIGVWIRCSDTSVFPEVLEGEVGLEFAGDGSWHRVFRTADGTLLRGRGFGNEGTWQLRVGQQLDLNSLGGSTLTTVSTLTPDPEVLLIRDVMVLQRVGGYQRSATTTPLAPAPPSQPLAGCPAASGSRTLTSVEEASLVLTGTWIRCSEASAMGPLLPGEVGFELAGGGAWHRIFRSTDGALLRGQGIDNEGAWELAEPMTGSPVRQLNISGLGSYVGHDGIFVLTATPEMLVFIDGSGRPGSGYVRSSGAPAVSAAPPSQPFPGCPAAGGSRSFETTAAARTALTDTWIRCSPAEIHEPSWNPDVVGVEITADGRFFLLVVDTNGMPVHSDAPMQSGTVAVAAVGTTLRLQFQWGGTTDQLSAVVFSEPPFLYLAGYFATGFVPWDGDPLPIVPPSL